MNRQSNFDTPDAKRSREIEIDVLVAHELATGSPAARLIWERAGVSPPPDITEVRVQYQQDCNGRPDDVRVVAGRLILSVEDKATGGQFQDGQVENYAAWIKASPEHRRVVLVAPRAFITNQGSYLKPFSAAVALEDLADALRKGKSEDPGTELRASHKHRASEFERCAKAPGWILQVDADVRASADQYRELLQTKTSGAVQLTPNSLQTARVGTAEFQPWASGPNPNAAYQVQHKFRRGHLDLRVPDWSRDDLEQRLGELPADMALPDGWSVSTAGRYPVLRHDVASFGPPFPPFAEVEHELQRVVDLLLALRKWWDRVGSELLRGKA